MKRVTLACLFLAFAGPASGQSHGHHHAEREIVFPDVDGYLTLSTDFHMHSVFSDGSVWPNIRVQEALRDGLDAISLTEHLEYQPHADDIPHPDRNRSYEVASNVAQNSDLIIISGSEITRSMPPGHTNAIFVEDSNLLLQSDSVAVFREAKRQGAFIFWDHPNWTAQRPNGIAELTDLHRRFIDEGMLHGIEVVNDVTYSDEALQIALDHNLTIMGTSDIHGLVDWQYEVPKGGHRPVTLVFSTERSQDGIKEGLMARRTVVWFKDVLVGREEHVKLLLDSMIEVASAGYMPDTDVLRVVLYNNSSAKLILRNTGAYSFHGDSDLITLEGHHERIIDVKTGQRMEGPLSLTFEVMNATVAPRTHPTISIAVQPE